MEWKSRMNIKREEAITLIFRKLSTVHTMNDEQLCDLLESLGYGDDSNLPYYGYNFNISDFSDIENIDEGIE